MYTSTPFLFPCKWSKLRRKGIKNEENKYTFDVFLQHIINNRINILIDIFEEDRESIFDGQLQLFQEVRIVECQHLEWWEKIME